MSFRAPLEEIAFALRQTAGLDRAMEEGLLGELTPELLEAVLAEAGRFATERLAPLDAVGDRHRTQLIEGAVVTPPGWREAYAEWAAAGWNAIAAPGEFGGQDLPVAVWAATTELWSAAAMAFGLGPLLTQSAIECLAAYGSPEQKRTYLPRLVGGTWMGTMNLTEPQAGSDLSQIAMRAVPAGDGSYRLFGQKIFITFGDHDLTENIVHFVLARLPDAPAGTKGISLFLVPKFLPDQAGRPTVRNDLHVQSLEHKLGIHGSPTCTMVYGDGEGAVGWLVGEANRGLAAMFTMMNKARLAVGLEGVAIAERAYQRALAYAHERRQGRGLGAAEGPRPIVEHPDVRRMLLLMRALTGAARAICYTTAVELDRARRAPSEDDRRAAQGRANLLIPVAKAFSTDIGIEVASLGIQVHGGAGYIEETGAARHYRDARITAIYEGTNGIQAIDLVTRKLPSEEGAAVRAHIAGLRATVQRLAAANAPEFGATAPRLAEAVDGLEHATVWLMAGGRSPEEVLAGATPYLRLFGLATGGALLAEGALAAARTAAPGGEAAAAGRTALARFFAESLLPDCAGLVRVVTEGGGSVIGPEAAAALAV